MSWLNRIENIELEIKTGDGKTYKPLWLDASKEVNYNYESFDFIGKSGSYIERFKQSGNQYPIAFYFVGENNIELSIEFEKSAADPNPWTISHPIYNEIIVQPLSLKFDNKTNNVTIISGTVWETIKVKAPTAAVSLLSTIESLNSTLSAQISNNFVTELVPISGITTVAGDTVGQLDRSFKTLPVTLENIESYKDLVRKASGAAQNITSDAARYINSAINLINFPFQIEQNIIARINAMLESFNNLMTLSNAFFNQYHGASILSNTCLNSLLNTDQYSDRSEIVNVINSISTIYNQNIELFTDPDISLQLDKIINFTLGGLLFSAQNAKQLRTLTLSYPDNIVNLSAKYFGLGEQGISDFIKLNKLSIDEYLQLKIGREIIYYQ